MTGATAQIVVAYQGQTAAAFQVPISLSAPGIFTSDATGKGQAAALNQDGSTVGFFGLGSASGLMLLRAHGPAT